MDVLKQLEENTLFQRFMLEYPIITLTNTNAKKYMYINDILERLKKYAITVNSEKVHGHYISCEWNDPTFKSGPDTCICIYINWCKRDILNGLNELYKINSSPLVTQKISQSPSRSKTTVTRKALTFLSLFNKSDPVQGRK